MRKAWLMQTEKPSHKTLRNTDRNHGQNCRKTELQPEATHGNMMGEDGAGAQTAYTHGGGRDNRTEEKHIWAGRINTKAAKLDKDSK